jgi:predicted permease
VREQREPPGWRRYLRFWGPDVEADIDDELCLHLEMRERDYRVAGLSPAEAREEALSRFGDVAGVKGWLRRHDLRRLRQERRIEVLSELTQDVRYAFRRLLQSRGFTAAVVVILALGIGATTAIFSLIHAALLRPLPYAEPERLVAVTDLQGESENPMSYPEVLDWQRSSGIFADLAAYFTTSFTLTGAGEPESVAAVQMSAELPRMLGAVPLLGRTFAPGEDRRSAPRTVILGEAFWRRRFGGDRQVIGRALTLEGNPFTVIGVFADSRRSIVPDRLAAGRQVDLWCPLRLDAEVAPRGLHFLSVVGRLRRGLSLAAAQGRSAALAHRLQQDKVTDHGIRVDRLERVVIGDRRPLFYALAGAVGLVLLIACANIANLLLARSAARSSEIAIRVALGAPRLRIVRQLLVESVLLALLGGAAGVAVAGAGVAALRVLGPGSLPRLDEVTVDGTMLGFALALSFATGLLFGLLPALRASRTDLSALIKIGARGAAGGPAHDRLRGALIVTEVALSFALLIGAGLLVRSLHRLLAVDKGFDPDRVVSASLVLPFSRYPDGPRQGELFRDVGERVAAVPGVQVSGFVNNLPLEGGVNGGVGIDGRTFPPDAQPSAEKRIASPGYFEVLRIPLVAGRFFDRRDVAGAPPVVVVNQTFARRYFPGQSAVGRRIDFAWDTTGLQEIVGVVGDVREQALHQPASPEIYIPLAQHPMNSMYLLVRAPGSPMSLVPRVRGVVYAVDRNLPLAEVRPLDEVVAGGLASRRLTLALFAAFSALALVLAAVGVYAVVSYSAQQRRREFGIRMALGAGAPEVARTVFGQGLVLITAGTVLGALAALALGRFLAGLVFGVGTSDPSTFAGVALLLVATAFLASLVPALRAAQTDPARVLGGD